MRNLTWFLILGLFVLVELLLQKGIIFLPNAVDQVSLEWGLRILILITIGIIIEPYCLGRKKIPRIFHAVLS